MQLNPLKIVAFFIFLGNGVLGALRLHHLSSLTENYRGFFCKCTARREGTGAASKRMVDPDRLAGSLPSA